MAKLTKIMVISEKLFEKSFAESEKSCNFAVANAIGV